MEENRKKALAAALSQIEKQFGKGSVMRLGDAGATYEVDSIPTGSLGLDIALGVGGIPRGRVIEIFGPESSGKTTLTLAIIASAQSFGGTAAFVDAEHALDPVYAEKLGVKSTTCWSRNPIPANRRWKSPTCWCGPARWMWWWSTRSPRSRRRPKSRARWAISTWACRRG